MSSVNDDLCMLTCSELIRVEKWSLEGGGKLFISENYLKKRSGRAYFGMRNPALSIRSLNHIYTSSEKALQKCPSTKAKCDFYWDSNKAVILWQANILFRIYHNQKFSFMEKIQSHNLLEYL